MGYRILGSTVDIFSDYLPRRGLEGPFDFNGRILYYCPLDGKY